MRARGGRAVYVAAGWLGARFSVIPGAGNPGIPGASWPAPLFGGSGYRAYVRKALGMRLGLAVHLMASPGMHEPCSWLHGWLGMEEGASTLCPWATAPLQHAWAATLLRQKVPGPYLLSLLCFPPVWSPLLRIVYRLYCAGREGRLRVCLETCPCCKGAGEGTEGHESFIESCLLLAWTTGLWVQEEPGRKLSKPTASPAG